MLEGLFKLKCQRTLILTREVKLEPSMADIVFIKV